MHQDLLETCEITITCASTVVMLISKIKNHANLFFVLSMLTVELSSIKRYRGVYIGQDVAVKVLKPEHFNNTQEDEFVQEVTILRYDWVIFNSSDCSKISNHLGNLFHRISSFW